MEFTLLRKMGEEYFLVQPTGENPDISSVLTRYVRWVLPVDHAWPCNPAKMEGFVEKAAVAISSKFRPLGPQAVFMGQLDPSATNRYYKTLASNLRGRALQLFPQEVATFKEVEEQDSSLKTLFCLVGKEGLFCGMIPPRLANGFYPGGTKFISQNSPDTISRAGAKVAEALHYLPLHQPVPAPGAHWLELGASPGGMTSELLAREYRVTAVDRAVLDKRLDRHPRLEFVRTGAGDFSPGAGVRYDAILSDMNGDAGEAMGHVGRLSKHLKAGGVVIFTLKTPGVSSFQEMESLYAAVMEIAGKAGLKPLAETHLSYNRQEFTLFFRKSAA